VRDRRVRATLVVPLAMVVTLCACDSEGARSAGSSAGSQPPSDDGSSDVNPESSHSFTRRCSDSVFGDLGRGWRRGSVAAGPLSFVGALTGYRHAPAKNFAPKRGRYRPKKVLAVVDNGPDVTVGVPLWERRHVGLVYDPELFNRRLPIPEADYNVNFDACRDDENPFERKTAQFNGAFVVAGPRCAVLKVSVGTGAIERIAIPFGHGCPATRVGASDQTAK
jgi:hypothetical protein